MSIQVRTRDLIQKVVASGCCVGCGACVVGNGQRAGRMVEGPAGPVPDFPGDAFPAPFAADACPGAGIDYPRLYLAHYGAHPGNWLTGHAEAVCTGHAGDPAVRRAGASGGVLTATLLHLLETGRVDAAGVVRQGIPSPEKARAVIVSDAAGILASSQSVYIPVSTLDLLNEFEPGKRYAMTCLPDQAAALRAMQAAGCPAARQVRYVLGPYTGTALEPAAIRAFLRSKGVPDDDEIASLQWRAGDWPGYLEIRTRGGRVARTKKVYYNFLIPFFVTRASLQSMDFANEFADLAVGDAWSPRFEREGGGHSVIVARTKEMAGILGEMRAAGRLRAEPEDPRAASDMHGHMLDFKKRGSYLRNRWRKALGRPAPDYGYRPAKVPLSRILVEVFISSLFAVCRTSLARAAVQRVPESVIGPLFNRARLAWKSLSKPTKRKGLDHFQVTLSPHE